MSRILGLAYMALPFVIYFNLSDEVKRQIEADSQARQVVMETKQAQEKIARDAYLKKAAPIVAEFAGSWIDPMDPKSSVLVFNEDGIKLKTSENSITDNVIAFSLMSRGKMCDDYISRYGIIGDEDMKFGKDFLARFNGKMYFASGGCSKNGPSARIFMKTETDTITSYQCDTTSCNDEMILRHPESL